MIVHIPSPLCSYSHKARTVEADGDSLSALLNNLDARYPGIRFRMIDEQARIRQHIKIFVNGNQVSHLSRPLTTTDEVHIVCALSGG